MKVYTNVQGHMTGCRTFRLKLFRLKAISSKGNIYLSFPFICKLMVTIHVY